jgi:hypothetical protein
VIHLTLNQISAYLDGELPEASIELVRLHLSACLECTERFGHIEEQEEALGRLLVNDPGDAFFAGFADRVLGAPTPRDSTHAEAVPAAAPEPRPPVAHAAAPAPPAVAPAPPPKPPHAPHHAPRRPPSHRARHAVLAASLLLVVSAIAVVAMRRGMMDSPSAAWILEHLDPTSWFGGPNRRAAPSSPGDSEPEKPPAAPADSNGAYPTVIDSGALDRAAARSAMAESVGSPEAYDEAAEAWLDALPLLANDPEEVASGRREVASARYVAWGLLPTPQRRAAALEAVRAYLLCAPPGAQRDLAWKWLARLKR